MDNNLTTAKIPWYSLSDINTSAVAAPASQDRSAWADLSGAFKCDYPMRDAQQPRLINAAHILFYGSDAANEAAEYLLWGVKSNGPIILLAKGVATLGELACGVNPITGVAIPGGDGFWADTVTVTDGLAYGVANNVRGLAGQQLMQSIVVDLMGFQEVYLSTTHTSVDYFGAIITGY